MKNVEILEPVVTIRSTLQADSLEKLKTLAKAVKNA
jgi:hypothetical protein